MVSSQHKLMGFICSAIVYFISMAPSVASEIENYSQTVTADACEDITNSDSVQNAEHQAIDKASLAAVKTSGIIQNKYPELKADALDLISYRIIDEYMSDVSSKAILSEAGRICVNISANININSDELAKLVQEHKDGDSSVEQIVDIADKVSNDMSFKPQTLKEKKLLYIRNLNFWNGTDTNHYKDLLTGLFSHSEYFYVTEDNSIADYVVTPYLNKAEVTEIDKEHHKMQIVVNIEVIARNTDNFVPITEEQQHFILFAADKDEQEIADNLLRKLLTRAAQELSTKIDRYSASYLENSKLHGK